MIHTSNYALATNSAYQLLSVNSFFSFDSDVFHIAKSLYNCKVVPYSFAPAEYGGADALLEISPHGFLAYKSDFGKYLIFYNDKDPIPIIRFTLAHEIGHYVLGHFDGDSPAAEKEANCFARNLLCPLPVADFFKLRGVEDYARFFHVSRTMASITMSQRHCDRSLIQKDLYDKIKQMTYERVRKICPTADFRIAI